MSEQLSFGARLAAVMASRGQLCVGIDPHPGTLAIWGLEDSVTGLKEFSLRMLEAAADRAAAIKPQVALYERHGSAGIAVLEGLLADAASAGVLTIADAKRGDIGSTMAAYADAWLSPDSALAADAVTLSPYLGFESLRPALDLAQAQARGVFVLALTSNPEGASVQHVGADEDEGAVARRITEAAAAENAVERARTLAQLGSTGLVIGATVGAAVERLGLDLRGMGGPILAPGLGAQGASGADLRSVFGAAYPQVLATSSRGIADAGPDHEALAGAVEATLADLTSD
ncbi:orotidine-5'-phosphate decarboxylase [Psychromicrobium xiongbiense]|uniref:orotidine-5'-phosphate decarboxylase n=1 Tax=Psychromicrobium xiongbiense TaxID=3051184 RepID=UPI0025561F55|nr:orotidine-5'-phosphate decarboxylase [Psychromicrobium sp. YIM S02556]